MSWAFGFLDLDSRVLDSCGALLILPPKNSRKDYKRCHLWCELAMARTKEKEECNSHMLVSDSSINLLKLMSYLITFVMGIVIGLSSSSHMDRYFAFQSDQYNLRYRFVDTLKVGNAVCEKESCSSLNHGMNDDELLWRASMVPEKEFPFPRVPRVAFMFLARGPLPMLPLWERFFKDQDAEKYSIYCHLPFYHLNVTNASVFYGRQIPSKV